MKNLNKNNKPNDILTSIIFSLSGLGVIKMFLGGTISEETGIIFLSALGALYFAASKTFLKKADEVVSEKFYYIIDVVNSDTSEAATLISGIIIIPAFVGSFHYGISAKALIFWCVFGGMSLLSNYLLKTRLISLESLLAKKLNRLENKVAAKMETTFWN